MELTHKHEMELMRLQMDMLRQDVKLFSRQSNPVTFEPKEPVKPQPVTHHWAYPSMNLDHPTNCPPTNQYSQAREPSWRQPRDSNPARHASNYDQQTHRFTGVYTLQANRKAFNQHEVDATCPLCSNGAEDREHFILHCEKLASCRNPCLSDLQLIIPGFQCYSNETKVQLILDHRKLADIQIPELDRSRLDSVAARLVFRLHATRLRLTS